MEWARQELAKVVSAVTDAGIVDKAVVEARPAWAFPPHVLIGRLRPQDATEAFFWVIGGEMPPDFIDSGVAATARDAARHFAMKWQLEAARLRDSGSGDEPDKQRDRQQRARTLEQHAVALYAFIADDRLWQGDPAA